MVQSTKRSVFPLKKSIALIMALSVLVCGVFAACSSKKDRRTELCRRHHPSRFGQCRHRVWHRDQ